MKWTPLPPRSRAVDLAGTAAGAVAAMTATALLASMGTEVSGLDGPSPRSMLLKGLGAIAALAVTFGLTAKLLRREEERRARGRVVVLGGHEPGMRSATRSAIGLAAGCLGVALTLMAILEVGAAAIGFKKDGAASSSGESALELARENLRRNAGGDAEVAGSSLGTGPWGGASRPGPIGPNDHAEGSQSSSSGVRLGDLLSDEPILRASSKRPLPRAAVHLRGFVLTGYGSNGKPQQRRVAAPAILSADSSGWILAPQNLGTDPRQSRQVELQVDLLAPSNGVVFAPAELQAVGTARATSNSAAALWVTVPTTEPSYRVRSEWPLFSVDQLLTRAARGSLPSSNSISMPAARRGTRRAYALRSLDAYADSLAAGSTSDLEEVVAVVSHLRDTFGYELFDAGMMSPEQCVELIERGSGSCTHFASLAALLLRSRGIPTRVAVGYVAREALPPEEGFGWLVRARDGHAWIEVHFEGCGWLAFDPTPGDPTVGGVSTGWTPLAESEPGVSRWLSSRSSSSGGSVGAGPRTSALGSWIAGAVAAAFQDLKGLAVGLTAALPASLKGGAKRPVAAVCLLAALLAAWAWRRRARRRSMTAEETQALGSLGGPLAGPTGREPAEVPAARELMTALTERGLIQGKTRTPSAFAREVEARHPESAGLRLAVRAMLRKASSRAQLTEDELRALKELSARLRSGAE